MSKLHIKPTGQLGKVFDVTPESAGWSYVGFGLYHLTAGDKVAEQTAGNEAILVVVEGKVSLQACGQDFGEMGDRMSVFERTSPHALYVPKNEEWSAVACTDCVLAVCTAPGTGTYPATRLGPEGIDTMPRGAGGQYPLCEQYCHGRARCGQQPFGDRSLHAAGQLVILPLASP